MSGAARQGLGPERPRRARRGAAAALAAGALALLSCSGDEYNGTEVFLCPSKGVFIGEPQGGGTLVEGVSSLMERRCGTLDCHGGAARPMRLYGQLGRRHPAENNFSGGSPTTRAELEANYAAVCGVEPEKMRDVTNDLGSSAEHLLLINKARGLEHHKGGAVVQETDDADQCIFLWLKGESLDTVSARCKAAIDKLR